MFQIKFRFYQLSGLVASSKPKFYNQPEKKIFLEQKRGAKILFQSSSKRWFPIKSEIACQKLHLCQVSSFFAESAHLAHFCISLLLHNQFTFLVFFVRSCSMHKMQHDSLTYEVIILHFKLLSYLFCYSVVPTQPLGPSSLAT